jgi:hypothetical protein
MGFNKLIWIWEDPWRAEQAAVGAINRLLLGAESGVPWHDRPRRVAGVFFYLHYRLRQILPQGSAEVKIGRGEAQRGDEGDPRVPAHPLIHPRPYECRRNLLGDEGDPRVLQV